VYTVAVADSIFTPGAARILDDSFVSKKGEPVSGHPYTDLKTAFQPTDSPACCSVYSCYFQDGSKFPWIRFNGPLARRESGLKIQVEWLHLEFDLQKDVEGQKVWPGVFKNGKGEWHALPETEKKCQEISEALCVGLLQHADWYISRGGLHILAPIEAISYDFALAYMSLVTDTVRALLADVCEEFNIRLFLDPTCAQPSRLMYLPQVAKPGQGDLRLPHSGGLRSSGGPAVKLPEPHWLPEPSATEKKAVLQVSKDERRWMENFAMRWLKSHMDWLMTAAPGTGRNARLYAFGGDIRQLGDVGLLEDVQGWVDLAIQLGRSAPIQPVHNAEQAVQNGYQHGIGTNTVAIGIADLEKYRAQKKRQTILSKLFK
jgi:hypothetical protein